MIFALTSLDSRLRGHDAMRRVQFFIATSLDGYIAGPDGDISWRFHDADFGYSPWHERTDTVLMGRRTYETLRSLREWPYAGRRIVVFSRRGDQVIASPDTVATARAPAEVVAELRAREGKSLCLIGGGELAGAFFDAGLVDDVIVSIHPVLLGGGTPLVATGTRRTALALTQQRRYPSGLVQLVYRVERESGAIRDSAARPA